jgi:hypothetical protein
MMILKFACLIIFLNCLAATTTQAQIREILEYVKPQSKFSGTPCLNKKSQILQAGIGIPNTVTSALSGISSLADLAGGSAQNKSGIGPLFLNYEYLIKENVGLGISFTYAKGKQDYSKISFLNINLGKADIQLFQIAFSTTYHIYTTDKLDPYFKGSVGLNLWQTKYTDELGKESNPFTAPTPFGYQGIVGMRYFLGEKYAAFGEVGMSSLKFTAGIGLAVKLR